MELPNYPANDKNKLGDDPRKNIKPVVKAGSVTTKKRSVGRKLSDAFVKEDVANVKDHIFFDVIVPTVKDGIVNVITNGINMIFYGETRATNYKSGLNQKTSYTRYYERNAQSPVSKRPTSDRYDTDDVILSTRAEAEDVLSAMLEVCDQYKSVSIADMYELLCQPEKSTYTDNYWGWTDLSRSSVRRVAEGYLIDLPRVVSLK